MRIVEIAADKSRYYTPHVTLEEIWPTISRECSEMINIYRGQPFLYRGVKKMRDDRDSFFKTPIRQRRTPRDASLNSVDREILDAAYDKLGIIAKRSNSVYCTVNFNEASYYGTPYIVFPTNGFHYSYFDKMQGSAFFNVQVAIYNAYGSEGVDPRDPGQDNLDASGGASLHDPDVRAAVVNHVALSLQRLDLSAEKLNLALSNHDQEVIITGSHYYGIIADYKSDVRKLIT